ncbi:NCS1 family nucleobase:cation symporter-1 [Saccharothrix australiensis]|uniref:NCS1 family nucleobase:cation symporter-1 n=1 Tax=Saccharothrix australiensis TaxID=2072 RepID=A0A495W2Z1_9PSEU|nr:NCS1 family nucleobase:cation symporter-1 [Saccharothrix australiensis]RKT56022.1 NCS1 family nucleobase:cation symporter-1 [Saccharothrix australiensis]
MALDPAAQAVSGPDGRVELRDHSAIASSPHYNAELAPVPLARRTWGTYNFFALWMGMAHNIPSYTLAASLVALGMDWLQALLTITLGNLIVLVPMLLNSHAGTKYGIPFPVFARAFYGVRGANLVALLRAFVACAWFGIQTWVGGGALHVVVGRLAGDGWTRAPEVLGRAWTLWLCFLVFWVVQMLVVWRGMEAIRRFENWTAPLVSVGFLVLLAYVAVEAGGFGPILAEPSRLGWGPDFWSVFFPALMGMIAFWSTLSLNMPDFTRFGGSQREQALGQVLGLPTTMSFIAVVAILTTSGAVARYGEAIWDPAELASRFDSTAVVLVALVALVAATVSANLAANVVSPAYDFSNAFPKRITFAAGGLLTGLIGVAIQPWRLISDPSGYVFAWLGFYGGLLGSVAGVLVAGYWVLARTRLALPDLYLAGRGAYWFRAGWNWRAVAATALGSLLAVGGAHGGPFPADGLLPPLAPLYDYNWVVGMVVGLVGHLALAPRRENA